MELGAQQIEALDAAIVALAKFQRAFGRRLSVDFIAELYAARELKLSLVRTGNAPGYDAVDTQGGRYQIKFRNAQNVDLNNLDFDHLVLVSLDDEYHLVELWRTTVSKAREIFTWREKYRKYQATQTQVKKVAERIR